MNPGCAIFFRTGRANWRKIVITLKTPQRAKSPHDVKKATHTSGGPVTFKQPSPSAAQRNNIDHMVEERTVTIDSRSRCFGTVLSSIRCSLQASFSWTLNSRCWSYGATRSETTGEESPYHSSSPRTGVFECQLRSNKHCKF